MERSTVRVFHSKENMGPLSLLFTSSKHSSLFSYSPCVKSNLPLLQVNTMLQLLGLGPHTTTMLVPVSDWDKIKGVARIRFQ